MANLIPARGVLCPQEYNGCGGMSASICSRCSGGWDKNARACQIETGAEGLPQSAVIPDCPIASRCQHQIQSATPCPVRKAGLICESALIAGGMSPEDAANHELAFNADFVS